MIPTSNQHSVQFNAYWFTPHLNNSLKPDLNLLLTVHISKIYIAQASTKKQPPRQTAWTIEHQDHHEREQMDLGPWQRWLESRSHGSYDVQSHQWIKIIGDAMLVGRNVFSIDEWLVLFSRDWSLTKRCGVFLWQCSSGCFVSGQMERVRSSCIKFPHHPLTHYWH